MIDSSDEEEGRRGKEALAAAAVKAKASGTTSIGGTPKPQALVMASDLFDDEMDSGKEQVAMGEERPVSSPARTSIGMGSDVKRTSPMMEGSAGKEYGTTGGDTSKKMKRPVATETPTAVEAYKKKREVTEETGMTTAAGAPASKKPPLNKKTSSSEEASVISGDVSGIAVTKKSGVGRKKKKISVAPEVEKEIRKAVRLEVQKRKSDAKSKILAKFKKELPGLRARPMVADLGVSRVSPAIEVDLPLVLPPAPSTPSALSSLPPLQRAKLISCCNFIYTFARPLGLLAVPTLPELAEALCVLAKPAPGGALGTAEEPRAEALRLLEDLCVALVRAVTPDVEYVLGLKTGSTGEMMEEVCSDKSGLVLPLNKLTWKEVARLSLVMFVYSHVGLTDKDIAECMRGRNNPRRNKLTVKLLKARLQRRAKLANLGLSSQPPPKVQTEAKVGAPAQQEADGAKKGEGRIESTCLGRQDISNSSVSVNGSASVNGNHEAHTALALPKREDDEAGGDTEDAAPSAPSSNKKEENSTDAGDDKSTATSGAGEELKEGVNNGNEDSKKEGGEEEVEEEEEEEEEMAEELSRELDAVLAEPERSESEKRLACMLKRLLQHSCSEKVGIEGTEDPDVESSLSEYVLHVWEPVTVAALVLKLKSGDYSPPGGANLKAGGVLELVQDVELLCRNSWACNVEDSEAWGAAEKFHAIFDRLLQAWVLEQAPERRLSLSQVRGLCQDLVEPCSACRQPVTRQGGKVVCGRCALTLHPECHRLLQQDQEQAGAEETDLWHCVECVDFRVRRQAYPALGFDEEDRKGDLLPQDYVETTEHLSAHARDMLLWLRMLVGEWGPVVTFPPLLDVTVSRTVLEKVKADSDLLGITAALALLGGRGPEAQREAGAAKGMETTEAGQQLLVLDALCQAASTHSGLIRSFLERQEQKVAALRKRPPKEEEEMRKELQEIGGDAAVLAWKDPMTEAYMAEEAAAAAAEDEDEDEEEDGEDGEDREVDEVAVCCDCKETTKDVDDSQVVLCESCPTEIHLRCLNPSLTEAPEKEWFCRDCKAKKKGNHNKSRQRQRYIIKAADVDDLLEAQRAAAECALLEDLVEVRIQEHIKGDGKTKKEKKTSAISAQSDSAASSPACGGASHEAGDGEKKATPISSLCTSSASSSPSEHAAGVSTSRSKCEYCGYDELEVCSPLVLGQTLMETEQYLAMNPSKDPWVQEQLRKRNKKKEAETVRRAKAVADAAAARATAAVGKLAKDGSSKGKESKGEEENKGKKRKRDGTDSENVSLAGTAATGEHIESAPLATVAPFFPRPDTTESHRLPNTAGCPIVHERCAIQMLAFRARAFHDRKLQQEAVAAGADPSLLQLVLEPPQDCKLSAAQLEIKKRKRDAQAVIEEALRISGTRTYALGQDRHGRCYWKMPGDETRLYVWIRDAESEGKETSIKCRLLPHEQVDGMGPGGCGIWLCYDQREDMHRLVQYMDTRHPKEAALRAVIEAELLGEPKVKVPRDDAMFVRAGGEVGGVTLEGAEMEVDATGADDDAKTETTDGVGEGGDAQADARNEAGVAAAAKPVALKFLEEKNQMPVPPEVLDIEVDPDIWGESLESKAVVRKTRKYHAVVLVDAEDKVWQGRSMGVKFQIFKGGEEVEGSSTPRAHKDNIFWFNVYEFLLPGLYTLRYTVDTFNKDIKPLCLRVEVRARRAPTSVRSVLNGHLSFLNVSRGGRYSLRQSVELDIPEDADEVVGLRIALLQLKETLPAGALLEGPEDLGGSGSSGSVGMGAEGESGAARASVCIWTDTLQAQWINHLMEAETAQEVMEGLLLLESCLHPEWLKPWFHPLRRAYAASTTHLLRMGTTPAAVAFHLFILDKALLYDKEKKVLRKTRGGAASTGGNFRRSTQRSRLEELSDEDDEEVTESEEEGDSDEDDNRKRTRSRKQHGKRSSGAASSSSSSRGVKHAQRSSFRKRAVVSYKEAGDNDIYDEESEDEPSVAAKEDAAQGSGGSRSRPRGGGPIVSVEEFAKECLVVLRQLKAHPAAGPFKEDVKAVDVPGYSDIVPYPMSLITLETKARRQAYDMSLEKFAEDVSKLWENSALYNGEDHVVTQMALELKVLFETWQREMKRRIVT
ncbi:bromodomain containing protein [Nannochloropsis oceanica]